MAHSSLQGRIYGVLPQQLLKEMLKRRLTIRRQKTPQLQVDTASFKF